jgi:hypothetical protein
MLAIGYWCENSCHGRIELREHKGHLFASLHNDPADMPNDIWLPRIDVDDTAAADPNAPPF